MIRKVWSVLVLMVALWSCRPDREIGMQGKGDLEVEAVMLGDDSDLRVSLSESGDGGLSLVARWRREDEIQTVFVQDGRQVLGAKVGIKVSSDNDKRCTFTVDYPAGIDPRRSFDLYALSGAEIRQLNGGVYVDVSARRGVALSEMQAPVWAVARGLTSDQKPQMTFEHLGCYEVIHVRNLSAQKESLSMMYAGMMASEGTEPWYYDVSERGGLEHRPYYRLVDGVVVQEARPEGGGGIDYPVGSAAYSEDGSSTFVTWYVPKRDKTMPECRLRIGRYTTNNSLPSRGRSLESGRAYHVYAVWRGEGADGSVDFKLSNRDEGTTPPADDVPWISVYAVRAINDRSSNAGIWVDAEEADRPNVWIDWNNNGVRDADESVTKFGPGHDDRYSYDDKAFIPIRYPDGSDEIEVKVYGRLTHFVAKTVVSCEINGDAAKSLKHLDLLYPFYDETKHPIYASNKFVLDLSTALQLEVLKMNGFCSPIDLTIYPKLRVIYWHAHNPDRNIPLDLSHCLQLEEIELYSVALEDYMDFSSFHKLKRLILGTCELKTLNLKGLQDLKYVWVATSYPYYHGLTAIDVSGCSNLSSLCLSHEKLTEIDVSSNINLEDFYIECNELTSLDVSKNLKLNSLYVTGTKLERLDLSQNNSLERLFCHNNPLIDIKGDLPKIWRIEASNTLLPWSVVSDLYQRMRPKPDDWVGEGFQINLSEVPGATTWDHSMATDKGWKVILDKPFED